MKLDSMTHIIEYKTIYFTIKTKRTNIQKTMTMTIEYAPISKCCDEN